VLAMQVKKKKKLLQRRYNIRLQKIDKPQFKNRPTETLKVTVKNA